MAQTKVTPPQSFLIESKTFRPGDDNPLEFEDNFNTGDYSIVIDGIYVSRYPGFIVFCLDMTINLMKEKPAGYSNNFSFSLRDLPKWSDGSNLFSSTIEMINGIEFTGIHPDQNSGQRYFKNGSVTIYEDSISVLGNFYNDSNVSVSFGSEKLCVNGVFPRK